jgi:CIC family chloride channel protein
VVQFWRTAGKAVNGAVARGEAMLRRYWRRALRVRERVWLSEEAGHLVLAGGVGVIGGFVNLFFYFATESVKHFFLRKPGDPVEVAEMLGNVQLVLLPALGGLVAGLILHWGLRLVGPQGSTNLLEAVVAGDGKLPFRSNMVKVASSLVSIGSGASIGREGGITQLTATLASKWGQLRRWPPYRLRLMVACGAASGIAAAYNAPITGAVFAALIVLGNFSMHLFAPLVVSSVVACVVSRSFFGIRPWYVVPPLDFTSLTQLPWFLVLGALAGVMGAVFLKMIRTTEDRFRRLRVPIYGRLALGGLAVGVIALAFPGVWGNGYVVTNRLLHEQWDKLTAPWVHEGLTASQWALMLVVGLLLAKLLATVATVGSGAVGGVFTPTLFLGAGLGAAFGVALQQLGATHLPTSAFALVGMGSVMAATTRSPLLAMILVFEISLNYSMMPPLMLGCVVSILVASRLHKESVYTEPLRLRGLAAGAESTREGAATERTVGDLMREPVPPVRENATLREMADRFLANSNNFLPVVDAEQRLVGMVSLHDLKPFLNAGQELRAIIAFDVMTPPPACVTPNQRLLDALPLVLASEQRNLPVVNTCAEKRLVGALARADVLGLFSEAIAKCSRTEA